ncbi:MAG: hypothetical protein R6V08_06905 [Desulfuromonadales bacterium]
MNQKIKIRTWCFSYILAAVSGYAQAPGLLPISQEQKTPVEAEGVPMRQ